MCQNDVFDGHGVKIDILDINNFLKIKETLERIGISTQDKTLYQSCHILHKKDLNGESKYAIVHFKEMFIFDGKRSSLTKEDLQRRDSITLLLQKWGLLKILDNRKIELVSNFKVIPYNERGEWNLVSKYQVGKKQF